MKKLPKVKTLYELESYICQHLGCSHFWNAYNLELEDEKVRLYLSKSAKKRTEEILIKWWNEDRKIKFYPEIIIAHRLGFILLQAIKQTIIKRINSKR